MHASEIKILSAQMLMWERVELPRYKILEILQKVCLENFEITNEDNFLLT
jgi:hypothetical protein